VIEIDTNLALPDGKKVIDVESGQLNIIDHVNLKGLTPGKEYILVGDIHSRMGTEEDGFIDAGIVKNESGQPAKSVMKFIPDTENTSVDVPFTIDVASLNAYPAVAFEELHESIDGKPGNLILAEHKEISDPDQTLNLDPVQFEETRIVPEQIRRMFRGTPIAQTGDAVLITGAAIIAVMLIAGIVFWRRRNRA
jgi:LPXTG-motif cell wall-anchored protein